MKKLEHLAAKEPEIVFPSWLVQFRIVLASFNPYDQKEDSTHKPLALPNRKVVFLNTRIGLVGVFFFLLKKTPQKLAPENALTTLCTQTG